MQVEKYVLTKLFGNGAVSKEMPCETEHHRLVLPHDFFESLHNSPLRMNRFGECKISQCAPGGCGALAKIRSLSNEKMMDLSETQFEAIMADVPTCDTRGNTFLLSCAVIPVDESPPM